LGIVLGRGEETIKTVPLGTEADMPVVHQLIDRLHRELAGVLLELLCQCDLDVFI
jgi:hypothetical protein